MICNECIAGRCTSCYDVTHGTDYRGCCCQHRSHDEQWIDDRYWLTEKGLRELARRERVKANG